MQLRSSYDYNLIPLKNLKANAILKPLEIAFQAHKASGYYTAGYLRVGKREELFVLKTTWGDLSGFIGVTYSILTGWKYCMPTSQRNQSFQVSAKELSIPATTLPTKTRFSFHTPIFAESVQGSYSSYYLLRCLKGVTLKSRLFSLRCFFRRIFVKRKTHMNTE